jgi:hypothetical protein
MEDLLFLLALGLWLHVLDDFEIDFLQDDIQLVEDLLLYLEKYVAGHLLGRGEGRRACVAL